MWLAPFPDPAHIGPLHLAALLFLRGDVRVATTTVDTGFSEVDSHYLQSFGEKGNRLCSADWLGAISSVGNRFFSRSYDGDADVVIASGRSGSASYARAKHAIVFADNPWGDLCNKTGPDLTRPLLEISPDLEFEKSVDSVWSFTSVLNIGEPVEGVARVAMKVASLPRGATPFGLSPDSRLCLGYVDDRFCAISDIRLGVDSASWFLYRVYRACAGHWNLPGAERLSPHEFVSDTGELRWNFRDGCLTIDTERSQGAAGFLRDRDILLRDVRITEVENEFSTFMLSSLDGLPLQSSARIVVLAIGKAENTGQHWLNRERTRLMGRKYEGVGTPPVLIDPVTAQITLKREHEAGMIEVHALDGAGRRTKRIEVKKQDGTVAFSIGREYSTIYYEIVSGPAAD